MTAVHCNPATGRTTLSLTEWTFAAGDKSTCLLGKQATVCTVPHTINVVPGYEEYRGKVWYRTLLPKLPGSRFFLHFEGAYRDTRISVGKLRLAHTRSGYTPFTVEITRAVRMSEAPAAVTVSVDNRMSADALPYEKSFDWPADGGLIRPVSYWL